MARKARMVRDFGDGPETFWFAEVKPGTWLEVNREPVGIDELPATTWEDPETGAKGGYITADTRYLHMVADELTFEELR